VRDVAFGAVSPRGRAEVVLRSVRKRRGTIREASFLRPSGDGPDGSGSQGAPGARP